MTNQIAGAVLVGLLYACSGPGDRVAEREGGDALSDQGVVQFRFEPTDDERRQLAPLVTVLLDSLRVPRVAVSLDRFGYSPPRYLLFVIPPPTQYGGNVLFAVARFAGGALQISTVYDTGVPFGPMGLSIEDIQDIDDDGLPDVLYCVAAADGSSHEARAVGFAGGAWYEIVSDSALEAADCRLTG